MGSDLAPLAEALAAAAALVARVAAGRSLSAELERSDRDTPDTSRAALADICYGTLRRYGRSQAIVAGLSRRAGTADPLVEALLWCSLYALESGRYAQYTVVDQAARACVAMQRAGAKGYVNAVLRNFLRAHAGVEARLGASEVAHHRHPKWWIDRVRSAYPVGWERVLAAGNTHPPMCLRVNARRSAPDEYAERLAAEGIASARVGPVALLLDKPVPIDRLPGFGQGDVSVQDAGAQRAAPLLHLEAGHRVLDACAAPGGKSAHILEMATVELTALDVDASRCAGIARDQERLGLTSRLQAADCIALEAWWDGNAFERILADVPCSASGVARRHPDIKWLRREADLAAFAARQSRILDALWRTLAPGGKLLYVTCSVFPEENAAVVDAFAARTPGASRALLPHGAAAQLLPGPEHDGFFFALLEKSA
ncbi:MAG: 16S rRNA (cytosine(967)-C(5))-methyltransferase RsmB [Candidatus Parcubacteria bacterium]|nr:16S rRNA (cytosine(967)-C(5))-methyltransferase RsmB [Burkholderiales bacterium]